MIALSVCWWQVRTARHHGVLLFATMLPVVLLAKYMSKMIKYTIEATRMPQVRE